VEERWAIDESRDQNKWVIILRHPSLLTILSISSYLLRETAAGDDIFPDPTD
jgi:hypothetical protein